MEHLITAKILLPAHGTHWRLVGVAREHADEGGCCTPVGGLTEEQRAPLEVSLALAGGATNANSSASSLDS